MPHLTAAELELRVEPRESLPTLGADWGEGGGQGQQRRWKPLQEPGALCEGLWFHPPPQGGLVEI